MINYELNLLELSCEINFSPLGVSGPALVIQRVEVLHNLYHCLSFGLWDEKYQECRAEYAVSHKNQEAELAESILRGHT